MDKFVEDVLVVDDDLFNRQGLCLYLQQRGYRVLEAGDVETAWELVEMHRPELAIIDIVIPPRPGNLTYKRERLGVQLTTNLKRRYPTMGIVLFSAYEDSGRAVGSLIQEGFRGIAYKLKGCRPADLLHTIREVRSGRVIIDAEVTNSKSLADEVLFHLPHGEREWVETIINFFPHLTPREHEVVKFLAEGYTAKEIAGKLDRSPKAVENYVEAIYQKLGLRDNLASGEAPRRHNIVLAIAYLIAQLKDADV